MATTAIPPTAPPDPAVDPAPAIEVVGLTKRYGRRAVLAGVDWAVPAGSVVGVLGRNGAGKTTLLKCALGLVRPDAGRVTVLGEPAWDLSAGAKARTGYVPQEAAGLYPWMRVRDLVAYVAAFYPRWDGGRVGRLMDEWDVDAAARVGRLSVGTRQRLAIILALAHEPDLLVLDEPAAALDPAGRRDFLAAVLALAAGGGPRGPRTVVFSTHITSDLERAADRVTVLRDGAIAYDGELDVLKESVKRLHVAAAGPLPAELTDLGVAGVMRARVEGADAVVTIRGDPAAAADAVRRRYAAAVRVEDLSLEDIFLEMQHAAPPTVPGRGPTDSGVAPAAVR